MSLFRPRAQAREASLDALSAMRAERTGTGTASVSVTQASALRHSAVWACLRQRANLLSTLPLDVYRKVGDVQVEVPKPGVLREPDDGDIVAWLWATQFDLDRYGNAFGVITQRDGNGLPARIELVPASSVTVRADGARVTEYRVGNDVWSDANGRIGDFWHERQHRPAGFAVGLCPIAMAAYSIGGYLSAQDFVLNFFGNGAVPASVLQAPAGLTPEQSATAKRRFVEASSSREPVVLPHGWTWELADVPSASSNYIDTMQWGTVDVARFLDWPADLIDGAVSGQSVTYASISQRNLQALVMHLGSAVARREVSLSRLVAQPRFVKLNTDALLRMDPQQTSQVLGQQVRDHLRAPSEARAKLNLAPYTPEQLAEFVEHFGPPKALTAPTTGGGAA